MSHPKGSKRLQTKHIIPGCLIYDNAEYEFGIVISSDEGSWTQIMWCESGLIKHRGDKYDLLQNNRYEYCG